MRIDCAKTSTENGESEIAESVVGAESPMQRLFQLWLCRLLTTPKVLEVFVQRDRFGDQDVSHFLGISDPDGEMGEGGFNQAQARTALKRMHAQLERCCAAIRLPAYLQHNLQELSAILKLDPLEVEIIALLALKEDHMVLQDAFNMIQNSHKERTVAIIARILNAPLKDTVACFHPSARLQSLGLIKWDDHRRSGKIPELKSTAIKACLLREDFSIKQAIGAIATPAPAPTLRLDDYEHLEKFLSYLRPYLRTVLKNQITGVNFYIHGAPGTGKSEMIRVIAEDLGAALYEISTEDEDGDANNGSQRLAALRMAQTLLKDQRSILVFDEAEDVFRSKSYFHRSMADESKGWMNRMLEHNPVPTFWVSNRGTGLDPAFMRRYDFVFEITAPPRKQRRKVFQRICDELLPQRIIDRLADCDDLTPAVVARAHQVAHRAGADLPGPFREEMFMDLVRETLKAQGHRTHALDRKQDIVPLFYDTRFLNCDKPVESIINSLHSDASCRICLYGPPGTGKTCLGHWLSQHLGKPLLLKKASDIISPYIGMTERNLASAFRQATDDQAILLIDEVDTFLQDRRHAQRSWEVSEVNEMLTQMEQFEGIFIASTNLVDGLDAAALRRFDLKLRFDFMMPKQARELLENHCRHLGIGQPAIKDLDLVADMTQLTPGDFANVARQHRFRNFANAASFVAALEEECRMKAGGSHRAAGF